MDRILSTKPGWAFAIYVFVDVICVGAGMGVPFFCILLGLPVGWTIARRIALRPFDARQALGKMLVGAALTSAVTFVGMALIWARCIAMLFDPAADIANFGLPLILYEPLASFIGWIALMIVISPFLQFLVTLFASHVTLWWCLGRGGAA